MPIKSDQNTSIKDYIQTAEKQLGNQNQWK